MHSDPPINPSLQHFDRMGASHWVPPLRSARRVARNTAWVFLAFLLLCALAPWTQSIPGTGRVIAYAPLERRQVIKAPISGRVVHWSVAEGDHVDKDDPILEISDNDPQLLDRLRDERQSLATQQASYAERVGSLRIKIDSVQQAFRGAVQGAEARVRVSQQNLLGAEQSRQAAAANLETAKLNLSRHQKLFQQGLESQRQLELAQLEAVKAQTTYDAARAALEGARGDLDARNAELAKLRADAISSVEDARAALRSAESDTANVQGSLARLDVRISRQHAQLVRAPRDGIIVRMIVHQGGEQVSVGDDLLLFVPDTLARAVEVWVDGNDASLISPGRHVRLQFEGWPAVQFTGWPSVAVGSFGGRVDFLDAVDDGHGNFRIVVVPDESEDAWPSPRFLRQGVRANAWVLLNQVPLGYELWRQFNGFPPSIRPPSESATGSTPKATGKNAKAAKTEPEVSGASGK